MRAKDTIIAVMSVIMVSGCETEAPRNVTTTYVDPSPNKSTSNGFIHPDGVIPEFIKIVGDRVFFDFDMSTLTPEAKAQLDKWVDFLNKYPNDHLLIEGHCDERGTREYNLALGERRANVVKLFLISKGIAAVRLKTISYGNERPAVLGSNEASWAQNRRVVGVPQ